MSQESNYSVTVKTPKGNLVTVRGDNANEWVGNLNAAATSGALGVIAQIESSLGGEQPPAVTPTQGASGGQQASQGQQSVQGAPAGGQQGSLNPACPTCGGPTTERTGNGQRGPWRGFFCANAPKNGPKHEVIWA